MYYRIFKRFIDIIIAVIAMISFSPIFLTVIFLIYLIEKESPFFLQERVGQGLRIFRMWKFRSMKVGSEQASHYTKDNDERITFIGKFLRKSSIDELPQLINVLFGDMSIVGPRPDVPIQQAEYDHKDWRFRHRVKPGIIGLAQVSGRSALTPKERCNLDIKYVKELNFELDMKILLKSLGAALKSQSN